MSASDNLPHLLPSLKGFKAERVLNDGKDNGGHVALLGSFEVRRCKLDPGLA